MKVIALFFFYPLAGWLVYKVLRMHHSKHPESANDDEGLHIFYAIIWPLTVTGFIFYILFLGTRIDLAAADRGPQGPFEPWQPKPPGGDYNSNNLGKEKGADETEDMDAFIKSLELRPDAPLPHELTFSYKLTGISKTYPAGTMFPSALLRDWKAGYFMGHAKADESFES
ncbi:MAG: hypothetical protein EPN97_07175 [Alphaproteobacteria bacterium]|nr:MAG: hypothetical protein EPN97_07175 [Alphaproteobacteria bacterium]